MRAWLFAGQGVQHRGMGADVLAARPRLADRASGILGYSVVELCRDDPDGRLALTRYAQPALFVVTALEYLERCERGAAPDIVAGHSLGELTALFAAGCFDFETGVELVRLRAELMAQADPGGMIAVVGLERPEVEALVREPGLDELDVANHNAPTQFVLSGPRDALDRLATALRRTRRARAVPLTASAPFHSRYMAEPARRYAEHLAGMALARPRIPVVANVSGEPYPANGIADLLGRQIRSPVQWSRSMRHLVDRGVTEVTELGPGTVLSGLWKACCAAPPAPAPRSGAPAAARPAAPAAEALGSASFRELYGTRLAYVAGSMFHGIASVDATARLARAGLLGFFGAGGLPTAEIEQAIVALRERAGPHRFGMNLLHSMDDPRLERDVVELYLRHDVRYVEAAAYTRITAPLVLFRFRGAGLVSDGTPTTARHVIAKVSRPDVARAFMLPPPPTIVDELVAEGALTEEEAQAARRLPVSASVCVEADSGGHTDGGVALALLPAMASLRDEIAGAAAYPTDLHLGAAGGLGAPQAVAAAFLLGADFVCTGSVNQCTPQAGTSDTAKDMLAELDVHDTAYAPAGDLFELGAKVQVVRRGTMFPARASMLHRLYHQLDGLHDLDAGTRRTLEQTVFRRSLDEVWSETCDHYQATRRAAEIERAEQLPKRRMALVFRWYLAHSIRLALAGDPAQRVNYQIQCGPAMGAFNRFAARTELEDWRRRAPDTIAEALMTGAAEALIHDRPPRPRPRRAEALTSS